MRSTRYRSTITRGFWIGLVTLVACAALILFAGHRAAPTASAQAGAPERLLALLSDGPQALSGLIERIGITEDASVTITILPVALSPHAENITVAERKILLEQSAALQAETLALCQAAHAGQSICSVYVAPILVRSDALEPDAIQPFRRANDIILIPDGNPRIAMGVIGGTQVEEQLIEAYQNGVVIAGYGRSVSLLSTALLAGPNPDLAGNSPLSFGFADVWYTAEKHGLLLGLQSAVINAHPFQAEGMSMLISAITRPDYPHLGISVENDSGVILHNHNSLSEIFGKRGVLILDAETYNTANAVQYSGCGDITHVVLPCSPFISVRNLLVHSLSGEEQSYSLNIRQHSLINPPPVTQRSFDGLNLPSGAGELLISGQSAGEAAPSPALQRFSEISRQRGLRVLIYADGFASRLEAERIAHGYTASLGGNAMVLTTDPGSTRTVELPNGESYGGIVFIAGDLLSVKPQMAAWIEEQWLSGKPLLVEGAAIQVVGRDFRPGLEAGNFSASPLVANQDELGHGLRLVEANFVPMHPVEGSPDWRYLFNLGVSSPDTLAIGIPDRSALEFTPNGPVVIGNDVAISLDLRNARLALGEDNYAVFANGMIDIFAPGDVFQPQESDSSRQVAPQATPALISPTPTVTPTATPSPTPLLPTPTEEPTKTPRPTATPPIIPPPSNPNINQWMLAFGVLIVVIILLGVLISRPHRLL